MSFDTPREVLTGSSLLRFRLSWSPAVCTFGVTFPLVSTSARRNPLYLCATPHYRPTRWSRPPVSVSLRDTHVRCPSRRDGPLLACSVGPCEEGVWTSGFGFAPETFIRPYLRDFSFNSRLRSGILLSEPFITTNCRSVLG